MDNRYRGIGFGAGGVTDESGFESECVTKALRGQ